MNLDRYKYVLLCYSLSFVREVQKCRNTVFNSLKDLTPAVSRDVKHILEPGI